MTRIRITLSALLVVLVAGMVASATASAMLITLGPELTEKPNGIIEAGEEKEFSVENDTGENVTITNIVLKPVAKPMLLEFRTPMVPECEVKVGLAKAAKCNEKLKDVATMTGGEEQYIIEAEGEKHKWKTILTWL
jgi:hypothetical protein